MRKHRVLSGTSPFRFGEKLLWILQEYLFLCIGCSKIPYPFRQLQTIQKNVVISIGRITPYPLDLEPATPNHLVAHALGYLVFGSKCFSFRDMALLTQLRIILAEPFLGKVAFIIHKPKSFVTGIGKEHSGLAVFRFPQAATVLPLYTGRMLPFFYKACVIHRQHAAACPNLPGQKFLVGIQKGLLIKRRTGKELLQGPDILFTGKVKGDWLNGFTFQRAQKSLYKGLEPPSLWLLGKAGKIILKIVFQFCLE